MQQALRRATTAGSDPQSRRSDPWRIDCVRVFRQIWGRNFAGTIVVSVKALAAFCGVSAAFVGCACAQDGRVRTDIPLKPVVVEMFLSQACNQSPPAADLIHHLAIRKDVVALTWHVDYWDAFPAPGVGAWKDPFAKPDFAARQISYNERIRGRPMKMTPQAVIDGVISVSGSQAEALEKRIVEAQFLDEMSRPRPPRLELMAEKDGSLRTRISNVGAAYDAFVVSFQKTAVTRVAGGDNAGVTFTEANVVRDVTPLAENRTGVGEFIVPAPSKGFGCAVLVQESGSGRIVAARYCGG
jgi:hypothetical protein